MPAPVITDDVAIKLIRGSLKGLECYNSCFPDNAHSDPNKTRSIPTITLVANCVAEKDDAKLGEKQMIAYQTICTIFLLRLGDEGDKDSTPLEKYFAHTAISS